MARMLCLWSSLLAVAVGVAPPAVVPPQVRPATLPGVSSVAQLPESNVNVAAAAAQTSFNSNTQLTPPSKGPLSSVPEYSGWQQTEGTLTQSLLSTSQALRGDQFVDNQFSQSSHTPTASSAAATNSLGALVLAAVVGAMAGGLWWRRRTQAVQSKDFEFEMTASRSSVLSEQPKFAVAPLASERPFDPAGLTGGGRHISQVREIKHGRHALLEALQVGAKVVIAAAPGLDRSPRQRVACKAAEIDVAEKTETKPIPYFESLPRTIIDKATLDRLLSTVPKEQWDDPPEDSYLYTLKCYAETYGEGKATRMGWWDFWYLKINDWDADENWDGDEIARDAEYVKNLYKSGQIGMDVPFPASWVPTGAYIKWRGPEPFAGDQCQTPVTSGGFAVQFINNMAFYREGLKPWQRGLEIGMAHGYFIIGPFIGTGPLRNTPEAPTVGLLCGAVVIGMLSLGGLITASTVKPTRFDKPGDPPASGFVEMANWHALGGLGGAGFAHALITVFGS